MARRVVSTVLLLAGALTTEGRQELDLSALSEVAANANANDGIGAGLAGLSSMQLGLSDGAASGLSQLQGASAGLATNSAVASLEQQLNAAFQQSQATSLQQQRQRQQLAAEEAAAAQELSRLGSRATATGEASATQGNGNGLPGYFGNAYPYAAGYPM